MKLTQHIAISIAIFSSIVIPEISIASTDRILVDRSTAQKINLYIAQNNTKSEKYHVSGFKKYNSGDYQGALADYKKAIDLNPTGDSVTYFNRGLVKEKLNDYQGALSDYNQAIVLNPTGDSNAYLGRAGVKRKLNDYQGALADYNQAIVIDPKNALAYNNRGYLKNNYLKDINGAIKDYRQAVKLYREQANDESGLKLALSNLKIVGATEVDVEINISEIVKNSSEFLKNSEALMGSLDKYALALKTQEYGEAGIKKMKSGDYQGALADFNQIVILDPKSGIGYSSRGFAKDVLKDRNGAIADYRQAAKLYRAQGDNESLKRMIGDLKELGVTENE
jgi:tetratricopeptide (TPR) repeat protein